MFKNSFFIEQLRWLLLPALIYPIFQSSHLEQSNEVGFTNLLARKGKKHDGNENEEKQIKLNYIEMT